MLPSKVMKEVMALRDRVLALEQQVARLQRENVVVDQELALAKEGVFSAPVVTPQVNSNEFNAFAYMQSEELEDIADRDIEEEEGELEPLIRVKSGLVAPPPERPDVKKMTQDEYDEFGDETVLAQIEERGEPVDWARNVLGAVVEKGGVINSYMKRQGLIPEDITDKERAEFKRELLFFEDMCLYKVNKLRHFYYLKHDKALTGLGDELDGEEAYERFIGRRADQ